MCKLFSGGSIEILWRVYRNLLEGLLRFDEVKAPTWCISHLFVHLHRGVYRDVTIPSPQYVKARRSKKKGSCISSLICLNKG